VAGLRRGRLTGGGKGRARGDRLRPSSERSVGDGRDRAITLVRRRTSAKIRSSGFVERIRLRCSVENAGGRRARKVAVSCVSDAIDPGQIVGKRLSESIFVLSVQGINIRQVTPPGQRSPGPAARQVSGEARSGGWSALVALDLRRGALPRQQRRNKRSSGLPPEHLSATRVTCRCGFATRCDASRFDKSGGQPVIVTLSIP